MGRRAKGDAPQLKHHKGKGLGYVFINGKPKYLGPFGTAECRANYRTFLREWETAQAGTTATAERPSGAAGRVKVGDLLSRFLDYARQTYVRADGTPTSEVRECVRAFKPLLKDHRQLSAEEFTRKEFRAVRQVWIDAGTMARSTINKMTGRVLRAWKWASSDDVELVSVDAYESLKLRPLPKGAAPENKRDVSDVDEATVDATLPYVSRQIGGLIALQWASGMRPDEACHVRGRNLDRDGRVKIKGRTVQLPGGVWTYRPEQHKNRRREGPAAELVYVLGPDAQTVLAPWLRADPDEYLFQPREADAERRAAMRAIRQTRVQPSQQYRRKARPLRTPGDHYQETSYAHRVAKAVDRANREALVAYHAKREAGEPAALPVPVPHWSPNQIRHSWITRVNLVEGLQATSEAVGHQSPDTTLLYVERQLKTAAEIALRHG